MDLENINKSSSTFWSLGNNPTQKINNLTTIYVLQHLKLLYLLSDKVLAAGSFYFESEITRQVTSSLQKLFEGREILYFIDEDIENFEEHGIEKIKKSPTSFNAYSDKDIVKERANKLDKLTIPLRRPASSISDKIVDLWIQDIYSIEEGTLGNILNLSIKEKNKLEEVKNTLVKLAKNRQKDFVWEYLLPHLQKLKLTKQFQNTVRRKLSKFYSISTAILLGVSLDVNDLSFRKYITNNTKYDTTLFEECMNIMGLKEAIYSLTDIELIKLKSSEEFIYFREFYFSLVESSTYKSDLAKIILPLFIDTEQTLSSDKIDIDVFTKSFSILCKSLKIASSTYKKPLEIILNRYNTFNKATLTSFISLVNETLLRKKYNQNHNFIPTQVVNSTDFYLLHQSLIDKIIINNFKIPKTDAPGKFGEMVSIIINWFDNFKKSEYPLALLILQNIKFFSEDDINKLLEKLSGELKNLFANDFSKVNILGLGDSGSDSGEQFLYRLRQRLNLSEKHFPKDYKNIPVNLTSIVFIDDIVGSGKQATKYYKDKLQNIKADKYYCSLLGFDIGLKRIKKETGFKYVFTCYTLSESDKAFSETSEIFSNEETRNNIKALSQKYGELLYPKGPLGYDDSQALIAFSHNTPNNTLPIIWASSNNEKTIGIPWNPLWDRKKLIERKNI